MTDQEKSKDEIKAEMDAAAVVAGKALAKLPRDSVKVIATWMAAHKPGAGYKRLGRLLTGTLPRAEKPGKKEAEE